MKKEYEYVNHPTHYNSYDVEAIEMMEKIWGVQAAIDFCKLNAFKYRMRLGTKPEVSIEQDLKKERWYLDKMNELMSKNSIIKISDESVSESKPFIIKMNESGKLDVLKTVGTDKIVDIISANEEFIDDEKPFKVTTKENGKINTIDRLVDNNTLNDILGITESVENIKEAHLFETNLGKENFKNWLDKQPKSEWTKILKELHESIPDANLDEFTWKVINENEHILEERPKITLGEYSKMMPEESNETITWKVILPDEHSVEEFVATQNEVVAKVEEHLNKKMTLEESNEKIIDDMKKS